MRETWDSADADRTGWCDERFGSYQNISLIVDKDGTSFLAAFCREGDTDRMDLYELRWGEDIPVSKRLLKRISKTFHCRKTSFRAGAGLRILPNGSLRVYSCSHRGDIVELFD